MAGSERPTPVPRAPRQGRLAPQHARVPAQRHSPTHVHVLAHVQQAIHELGRELPSLSLSLSLLFALFLPPSIAVLRSQNPLSLSLSRYEPHLCALYPPPPPFSHVYRTRLYFINAPRFFQPKLLASFYDLTRADGLNNSGECTALLSFFRVNVAGYCSVTWDGRGCGRK